MPVEEEKISFWRLVFKYWYLKILAVLSAFFLWLYVNITDKESFQWEIPIKEQVIPNYVYITGKVVSRLNRPEIFRKYINVELVWDKDKKSAKVLIKSDIPKLFLEIESYYPKRVTVQRF
jgi:hypothetical protein